MEGGTRTDRGLGAAAVPRATTAGTTRPLETQAEAPQARPVSERAAVEAAGHREAWQSCRSSSAVLPRSAAAILATTLLLSLWFLYGGGGSLALADGRGTTLPGAAAQTRPLPTAGGAHPSTVAGAAPTGAGPPLLDTHTQRKRHCRGQQALRKLASQLRTTPEARHEPADGIVRLLREITRVRHAAGENGDFVEIGANDGQIANDSCAELGMRFGWRGVALEPVPRYFALLAENYAVHPSVRVVNKALARESGSSRIFTATAMDGCPWWLQAVSSFREDLMQLHVAKARREGGPGCQAAYSHIDIAATTFRELAAEYGLGLHADFLQVDTEGFDLEVTATPDPAHLGASAPIRVLRHSYNPATRTHPVQRGVARPLSVCTTSRR